MYSAGVMLFMLTCVVVYLTSVTLILTVSPLAIAYVAIYDNCIYGILPFYLQVARTF